MAAVLRLTGEHEVDALLSRDPLALLIGMLLDQQVPMEWAFSGPHLIAQRLGRDDLDAAELADYDPDALAALFTGPPAVHRYPKAMAGRVQALCRFLVERYQGDAGRLWAESPSGPDLLARLKALPGFGPQKSQIFLALLGKQRDVQPDGWRAAAGPYGEEGSRRSIADVTDEHSLEQVRAYKRETKQAAKAAKAEQASQAEQAANAEQPEQPAGSS